MQTCESINTSRNLRKYRLRCRKYTYTDPAMSRLDRLVVLLETGSTPFIRNTAADQLSDLARGHPEEIILLLGRVYPYLHLTKWETRIAAARAFGGIVNHAEATDPNLTAAQQHEHDETVKVEQELAEEAIVNAELTSGPKVKVEEEAIEIKREQDEELAKLLELMNNLVTFDQFSLADLVNSGKRLLADRVDDAAADANDGLLLGRIKKQRIAVDVEVKPETTPVKSELPEVKPEEVEVPVAPSGKPVLLARLKAMQKRRAKVNAKLGLRIRAVDISQLLLLRQLAENGDTTADTPQFDITPQQGGNKLVVETKAPEILPLILAHKKVLGLVWQFQGVYELLLADLFDDKWEVRHGAALGLRELVRTHGPGAGRVVKNTREQNDANNAATLEDLAVRLCVLFTLDRFGDYVSDTVVAPVRELCAQTLAALLIHLNEDTLIKTFNCLYLLVLQEGMTAKCWEAKHGGMLGVRYFVLVRTDVLMGHPDILDRVVEMVLHGLNEPDDDVQAVAALTLAPIALQFVTMKKDLINTLLKVIWNCLTHLRDDLLALIGLVMDLLAKLCTHPEVIDIIQHEAKADPEQLFQKLVPRLFPFLRHLILKVRKAVLRTMLEFLLIADPTTKKWISPKALRLIFQNLLVEQNPEVLALLEKVYDTILREVAANPGVLRLVDALFADIYSPLLTLLMTPIGFARHNYHMNTSLFIRPLGQPMGPLDAYDERARKRRAEEPVVVVPTDDFKVNIDIPMFKGDVMLVGDEVFINTRCAAATAFGRTLAHVSEELLRTSVVNLLVNYLTLSHTTLRLLAPLVVHDYAVAVRALTGEAPPAEVVSAFAPPMEAVVASPELLPHFRELVPTLKAVRLACMVLFDAFILQAKVAANKIPQIPIIVQGEAEAGPGAFGLDNAQTIHTDTFAKLKKGLLATYRMLANQGLEDANHRLLLAITDARSVHTLRTTAIVAACLAAILAVSGVPKKLNPVIRLLMDSVKEENTAILQLKLAQLVLYLINQLIDVGKSNAADKIIKNLCAFLCVDTSEVPELQHNLQFTNTVLLLRKEEAKTDPADIAAHEKAVAAAKIKRHGAMLALLALIDMYKAELFDKVPKLRALMLDNLDDLAGVPDKELVADEARGQAVIDALGILRALLGKLDPLLHAVVEEKLPVIVGGLKLEFAVFRYLSAKCFATVALVMPAKAFMIMVNQVLPMLGNGGDVTQRQGAIETIYHISTTMGADILPYIVFLIVPVLGRMSDADHDVRVLATTTFAAIIKLVPLEAGIPDPPDMPADLLKGRDRERDFIQQMMDPTKIKPFELPVLIKATLRKYQQEGVNWLAFLNKYHLHGILCDDMGLGKTLQTICIVSLDHYNRRLQFDETKNPEFRKLPTLIICPPSLTGHWEQEIQQYAPFMLVLVYAGGPLHRAQLRPKLADVDVVVTLYDVCRNDVDHVTAVDYNYCVLDEGHIIKNLALKLTKLVKRVRAQHRLILLGTPIQNNVLELWSLFDFLMPGFLGTEKVFHEKFAKPIAALRNSKTSSKEQEAGALALELLHKQVLPFMLRRLKEDVLSDLPPKIIQDYYCELLELQKKLYKEFAAKQKQVVREEVTQDGTPSKSDAEGAGGKTHVFQALQYMRKLCNHPALVMLAQHPKYDEVNQYLAKHHSELRAIEHAPKLLSLKTLLLECGIGVLDVEPLKKLMILAEGVILEHRALIFCQLKDMLDIVENELLKKYLPLVTYMRLDGLTDPRDRQAIVRKFNEDPLIDLLLLTTKVGGLGLNLTGADTVIFVEHDWNPMNDLQAMDRAHRLGQKKVVNVYRLITKDTLEEKIMGLQKFKMNIALTIVNQQNAGLLLMDTNQLLDLFEVDEATVKEQGPQEAEPALPEDVNQGLTGKAASAVEKLADLWDELQYEDEYNLDNFIKTLK